MSTTDHNGFTNQETYITNLYYSEVFQEITRDYLEEFADDPVNSIVDGLADAFEGAVEEYETSHTPEHSLSRRLAMEWIRKVDWVCLAETKYNQLLIASK